MQQYQKDFVDFMLEIGALNQAALALTFLMLAHSILASICQNWVNFMLKPLLKAV